MPGNPTSEADFGQPDINGIPLGAVQRIETRTGTAGGIYGPGALGGVLNLVLRRDYEGAELRVTSGVTTRGDARTLRAEIGYGFSPNNGRTEVMLAAGHRRSVPLLQGQRDYAVRQRRLQFSNSPADYASLTPLTNAILVFGVGGENLRFDEKFGGDSLGSPVSYLPVGFSGTPEEARQLLRQNAGRTVFELAPDPSAALQHVVASPTITSLIANIRHQVSDTVEAYVDGLLLRNAGRQTSGGFGLRVTLPNAPTNPFDQFVRFAFPTALGPRSIRQQSTVARISGGLIIRLPGGWSANGDYTAGRATAARIVLFSRGSDDLQSGLQFGTPRSDGRIVDPLGPWDDLMSALAAYTAEGSSSSRLKNNFSDASLRLAGPVVNLPGGPMTTTFLLERRQEKIPDALEVSRSSKPDRVRETKIFERSQLVTSAYGELRAPLTAEGGLLGDLQIQLALRYDLSLSSMPNGVGSAALSPEERPKRSERGALTYTAGAQFQPIRRLMLRASLASGELPPSLAGLSATAVELGRASPASLGGSAEFPDPLRGGRSVGSERLVRVLFGGLKDAPPERAQTFSAGAVLNPKSRSWPRISVDYVRISRSRQPFLDRFQFELPWGSLPQLLAGTTDRLTRAPLTDADRTLGFTGGVITQADVRGLLLGSSIVEAVDVELDWSVKAGRFGTFRLYGRGTWQPTLRRQTVEGEPWFEDGDDIDGPLRWRGHGGIEWTRGASAIGINAQYFSSYRAAYGSFGDTTNGEIQRFQGSERISSQTYFDLNVRHRFSHILELSAGVINLFDRSPPIAADRFNVFGYSYHGDPRRRRLELALSKKF
jgi:outer membrane receptor protein involved in Fe transport